eukprot:3061031-Prymnesium_polylepis.1
MARRALTAVPGGQRGPRADEGPAWPDQVRNWPHGRSCWCVAVGATVEAWPVGLVPAMQFPSTTLPLLRRWVRDRIKDRR